jgi:hypothetical protein
MTPGRTDDPAVEADLVAEAPPDSPEDLEVLVARVRVDRGNDAALAHGVDADHCIADNERVSRQAALGISRNAADQQVGTKPADVSAELCHNAVGGDEQVEHIEAFRTAMADQAGIWSGDGLDRSGGLRAVPRVAGHPWDAVRAGVSIYREESVASTAGQWAVRTGDMDDSISAHAILGQLRCVERLAGQ